MQPVATGKEIDASRFVGVYGGVVPNRTADLYIEVWPAHPQERHHFVSFLSDAEGEWKLLDVSGPISLHVAPNDHLLVQLHVLAGYWLDLVRLDRGDILWTPRSDDADELKRLRHRFGLTDGDGELAHPLRADDVARYLLAAKGKAQPSRFARVSEDGADREAYEERRRLARDRYRYKQEGVARKAQASGGTPQGVDLHLIQTMHEYGDPWATYVLARLHFHGWFVNKDVSRAHDLAEQAVASSYGRARNLLGMLAAAGLGPGADEEGARRHFAAAGAAGEAEAYTNLALLDLGSDDRAARYRAIGHLERAAAAGEPVAADRLGTMHLKGELVAQDDAAARRLFEISAERGFIGSAFYLGLLRKNGRGGKVDEEGAVKAYAIAAEMGSVAAKYNLGLMHLAGKGTEKDAEKAVALFREGAKAGDPNAMGMLAYTLETGQGTNRDDGGAAAFYSRCAATGDTYCQWRLGRMMRDGRGVTRNPTKARALFEQAVAGGEKRAEASLAKLNDPDTARKTDAGASAREQRIASTTDHLVRLVLESPWTVEDTGYRKLKAEFYSQAIFTFAVKPDRSRCFFHFWRKRHSEDMLNKAIDEQCDGTVEYFRTFAENDLQGPRLLSPYQQAFYDYYLKRYYAVFEAVNDFKTYLPEARLALLPDFSVVNENRRLLQSIATAATGSTLKGVPRGGDGTKGEVIFRIWVNEGEGPHGFSVAFLAEATEGRYLRDCYVNVADSKGEEALVDKNCDGVPESWKDNRGIRSISMAGNEKVVHSLLLDVARFADAANTYFNENDLEAVARAAAQEGSR